MLWCFDVSLFKSLMAALRCSPVVLVELWSQARAVWEDAIGKPENMDKRVPLFIILDEAHNFIPDEPRSRSETALREQFRTIASEGRKFGLFLVLARTGPDECLYLQMLLEHLEDELDFPAVPVDSADGGRTKAKVVGQKFNLTLVIFIPYYAPCQCFSPGGTKIIAPGPTLICSFSVATIPLPLVTISICS